MGQGFMCRKRNYKIFLVGEIRHFGVVKDFPKQDLLAETLTSDWFTNIQRYVDRNKKKGTQ